jgi:hypothetical protein
MMRNSPWLPTIALIVAFLAGVYVGVVAGDDDPLNELQLGLAAGALALAIFGVQGLISVLVEGETLRLGRRLPRLTDALSIGIMALTLVLFCIALLLAYGIADDWRTLVIGSLAGAGCIVLALLLVFYKEAYLGDEAELEPRDDGIPW